MENANPPRCLATQNQLYLFSCARDIIVHMMQMKVMIAEDEPLARKRLKRQLAQHADVVLVAEAVDGSAALTLLQTHQVDLLFLDVQMPGLDGFQVLAQLENLPFVIFVTAYDQYALKAFDVHALDYLLKPYDNDRFNEALQLARAQFALRQPSDFKTRLRQLLQAHQSQNTPALDGFRSAFPLKNAGRILQILVADIYFLETSGNYLTLHTGDGEHLYRGTMNAVAAEIDPKTFLRVHRSYLINMAHVNAVRYLNNSEYKFTMRGNKTVISGRSYKDLIMAFLSEAEHP